MSLNKLFIYSLLLLFTFSCSKKEKVLEPIYTPEEFAHVTEHLTAVNPTGENAIPFHEYSPKVNKLISKTFVHERLKFYAVGFDTVEDARAEALRLNQYFAKNYMFDQTEGEPVLEDFVITTFKAINPKRKIQRVPKTHEEHGAHGEAHGEAHGAPAAH
jgi:hypothetical protein